MAVVIEGDAVAEPIVAIVGAGPAGVRAAETLARAGLTPILFDEAERPGGQIYRQPPNGRAPDPASTASRRRRPKPSIASLADLGDRIDYRPRTLVWNLFEDRLDLLRPRRLWRAALRPADPRDRRHGPGAAFPRLDAARRVHARRGADRAQGAGCLDRPPRRLRRGRAAAAACRASICEGRRRRRRGARRDAVRREAAQLPGLLAEAGTSREGPLVHGAQPPAPD